VIGWKLAMDFVFPYIEEVSDMLNHLLIRPGCLGVSRAIRRRRGNDIRSAASVIVGWRWRVRRDKNGGRGIRHVVG